MDPAVATFSPRAEVVFQDRLGERRHTTDPNGKESLEMLCLRAELTAVPSFEFALRERVTRLASFRPTYGGRVRRVDRLKEVGATIAIVSDATPGVRLSEVLTAAETQQMPLDVNAALCLVRQLVTAAALLHENARDVAHGAIGPERLVITPHARVALVEYVMGAALEQLRFSHERYWKELRIPLPQSAGLPHFDHRADVLQIGVVALALILGRQLHEDEYPSRVRELVTSAPAISACGDFEALMPNLRLWLARALQLDVHDSFASTLEARGALDEVLSGHHGYMAAPEALESFLARYRACTDLRDTPTAVAPRVVPPTALVLVGETVSFSVPVDEGPVAVAPRKGEQLPAPQRVSDDPKPVVQSTPAPAAAESNTDVPSAPMESPPPGTAAPTPKIALLGSPQAVRKEAARRWTRLAAAAVVLCALAGGAFAMRRHSRAPSASAASTGTLSVNTNPPGAQVMVDGQVKGVTPISVTLNVGRHVMELSESGELRTMPLTIAAGSQASHYIEFAKGGAASGQLEIRSDRPGARVTVDGVARGALPMTIADLAPGEHTVAFLSDGESVKQTVTITHGTTTLLVMPLAVADGGPPSAGWISASAPVDLQLFENGRLLGSNQSGHIMIAAGTHQIDVVNETLGYRAARRVQVLPGKVVPISVQLPKVGIALNAIPWAEVWIDEQRVGETPIGNASVAIGPHEVLFRHPDLGEQRRATTVTLSSAARLSVDMTKRKE